MAAIDQMMNFFDHSVVSLELRINFVLLPYSTTHQIIPCAGT